MIANLPQGLKLLAAGVAKKPVLTSPQETTTIEAVKPRPSIACDLLKLKAIGFSSFPTSQTEERPKPITPAAFFSEECGIVVKIWAFSIPAARQAAS